MYLLAAHAFLFNRFYPTLYFHQPCEQSYLAGKPRRTILLLADDPDVLECQALYWYNSHGKESNLLVHNNKELVQKL